jgi:hypothetical protein
LIYDSESFRNRNSFSKNAVGLIMREKNKLFLSQVLLLLVLITADASSQLYKLETKNSKIISYGNSYSYLIPHVGAAFEGALQFHSNYWNNNFDGKVVIFLNDFSDVGNGGAMTIPRNFLMLNIAPFDYTFDIMPANERFQWLMNHETTHLVMADKPSGADKTFRNLFSGKINTDNENPISMFYSYLTAPRWYSPRWFHEGIAVFMETWMSGGLGRVLGGYDEMVFRAMVKENAYFYQPIGLETEGTTIDFQVGVNSYLYGTRFVTYLSSNYGLQKVKEFYQRDSTSSRFYATQFHQVFGKSIVEAWSEWVTSEKIFQSNNLKKIEEFPLTSKSEFTSEILGSVSRPYFNRKKNEIYCAINRPGDLAILIAMNINNGKIRKIANVESPGLYYVTSFAYDEENNRIFCTTHNQNWRGIKTVDLANGKEETLFDYARIIEMAFSEKEKAIYGIQVFDGRTAIVKLTGDFKNISTLYSIPFGKSIFDIDISPNGTLLSGSVADAAGKQKLMIFNIDSLNLGKIDSTTIYEFEDNSVSNFVFTEDGENLIGTSYYTGVSNVYKINIESKSAELMTNTDIGFFRPMEISVDSLLIFEYTTNGLKPYKIKKEIITDASPIEYLGMRALKKNPELADFSPEPASTFNNDDLIVTEGNYIPLKEMSFENGYPIVEGFKDFVAYGVQLNISDDLMLSRAKLKISYSHNQLIPKKQRLHLDFRYNYWDWEFKTGLNKASFYDLFGPTKSSRTGYFLQLGYTQNLILEKPIESKIIINAAHFGDLEKLPQYQNIDAGFSQLSILSLNFYYSKFEKSIGAIEYESGYKISSDLESAYFSNTFTPKFSVQLEKAFLTPLRNSSFWFRTSAGRVFAEKQTSFSKNYFGGFGNNYIDRLEVHRYRDIESFAGREINEISGKDFVKIGLEWNLPPVMFREFGFLSAYVRFARLSFFESNLITDVTEKQIRRFHFNAGAQLDFELVFFSLLKSTLSFGYARAFEKYNLPGNEFMISLKLL